MEVSRRGSKALKHDISKYQQLPTTGRKNSLLRSVSHHNTKAGVILQQTTTSTLAYRAVPFVC